MPWNNSEGVKDILEGGGFQLLHHNTTMVLGLGLSAFSLPLRIGVPVDETIAFGTSVCPRYGAVILKECGTQTVHVWSPEDGVAEAIIEAIRGVFTDRVEVAPLTANDIPMYTCGSNRALWHHLSQRMEGLLPSP